MALVEVDPNSDLGLWVQAVFQLNLRLVRISSYVASTFADGLA